MAIPISSATQVRMLAREQTEAAIRFLASLMHNEDAAPAARVAAANSILDRGWGKPAQVISGDDENPLTLITRIELVPALTPPPF